MSLLMEALKKAEQAKRKVTEGPVAVAVSTSPPPALALELAPAEAIAAKPEPTPRTEKAPSAAPTLTAAAFTLMTGRLAEVSPLATSLPAEVQISPLHTEAATPPTPAPVPQPHTVPAPAKPELSLDISAKVTRPLPAARSLPQRQRISTVWIGGGVALLFALAGGGYWYYNSMAQYLTQQSTLGVPPSNLAAADGTSPPPVPVMVTPPAPPAVIKTPSRSTIKIKPVSKPSVESAPVASPAASISLVPAGVPAPIIAVPNPASPAGSAAVVSVPVPPPPAPINISRDAEQNDTFVALQTAYRAYQNGDDSSAQNLYARVLGRDEHNRDALLGLAAIAVRQKDFVRAQEIYSELLTLDPKDSIAQAGFVSVSGSFDPLQQEARIKALLEQEPGASHLLFTYATFLMQQQRWLEATRTLQSAVQAQRDNADYAFNLAVSFDHLGQVDSAVKYYRAALELSAKQSTRFHPDDVRRRLKAMSATNNGAP